MLYRIKKFIQAFNEDVSLLLQKNWNSLSFKKNILLGRSKYFHLHTRLISYCCFSSANKGSGTACMICACKEILLFGLNNLSCENFAGSNRIILEDGRLQPAGFYHTHPLNTI
jgi:hypothetical protein